MSADFDADDLARLLALEHAFCSLALISASNFARLNNSKPSEAVAQFRAAIEGSIYDTAEMPPEVGKRMRLHLRRLFDHVAGMAIHADKSNDR